VRRGRAAWFGNSVSEIDQGSATATAIAKPSAMRASRCRRTGRASDDPIIALILAERVSTWPGRAAPRATSAAGHPRGLERMVPEIRVTLTQQASIASTMRHCSSGILLGGGPSWAPVRKQSEGGERLLGPKQHSYLNEQPACDYEHNRENSPEDSHGAALV
jgi:hypothetical protein